MMLKGSVKLPTVIFRYRLVSRRSVLEDTKAEARIRSRNGWIRIRWKQGIGFYANLRRSIIPAEC